ncbi:hypothetical protein [Caulobacter sp. DWR2-3-1b2]|uniref:hypothetical protein n=1 Tax=unclassified Caulobacter TaxID=2648921 RepID=UPI003CF11914
MAIQQVLFDARSPFEQFSVGFAAIGVVALIAALVRFWLNRRAPISEINSMQRVEGGVMVGVAALLLGAAMLPFLLAAKADLDFHFDRVVTLEGCTRGVERVVHERVHGVADTYLSVAGRALHFNSSPWRSGFHNAGDTIRDGQYFRVFMAGDTVLRLERLPQACPSA